MVFLQIAAPSCDTHYKPANLIVRKVGAQEHLVEHFGVKFMVWNNGGEVGVERINSGKLPRFFPLTWHGQILDAGTLYLRLMACLRDEPINFDERLGLSVKDITGR